MDSELRSVRSPAFVDRCEPESPERLLRFEVFMWFALQPRPRMKIPPSLRLAVALVFSSAAAASAQQVMTFTRDCTGSGTLAVPTTYSEAGFVLTTQTGYATWCDANPNYGGDALFINFVNDNATLTSADATPFSIQSIDLARVFAGSFASQSFTFTGHLAGGGDVFQTFTVPDQNGATTFSTFAFNSSFNNLSSLDFATQVADYYQVDNVVLNSTAVPEPASLLLLATGFGSVAGVGLKRRRASQA